MKMRALRALTIAFVAAATTFAACPGERFDVSIKEPIALKDALLTIIDECDLSLSLEGEGAQSHFDSAKIGYVTLRAVSAEEAVDFFLQRANLHGYLVNDLLTVRYLDTKLFRVDFVNNSRIGSSSADVKIGTASGSSSTSSGSDSSSSDSSTSIKTEEKFDLWSTLSNEISSVLSRPEDGAVAGKDSVFVNPTSGLVTVTGTRRQIDRISEYLDKLLTSLKKQVMIDVQIYEVVLESGNTSGIDWSKLSISFGDKDGSDAGLVGDYGYKEGWTDSTKNRTYEKGFTFSGGVRFNAAGLFDFLKTQGDTRSLSNPKVLAMNNQPTLISVGRNLNYQTLSSTTLSGSSSGSSTQSVEQDSLFVGVLLDITPQIDDDGYITLRLNPSYSDLLHAEDLLRIVDAAGKSLVREIAPDTKSHRISSVVRVRDNDVIVLGGLIDNSTAISERKIPILGDIPFLGRLFGSKKTTDYNREIVFVLTPHVVTDNKPLPSLKALGFGDTTVETIKEYQVNREPKLSEFDDSSSTSKEFDGE
jgi:general secretion pathway protein D